MKTVNIREAKAHLSRLLEDIARGEDIIIAKAGRPAARLVRYEELAEPRVGGQWKGLVHIHEDFDAPLPSEVRDVFGETGL